MECMVCGNEFEARRSDALYCSDVCRQRRKRVTDNSVTDNLAVTDKSISMDEPCEVFSGDGAHLDLVKDLGINLGRDLGITSWTSDGVFLRHDITIDQVQNIARLIHAKHGRKCPEFKECR